MSLRDEYTAYGLTLCIQTPIVSLHDIMWFQSILFNPFIKSTFFPVSGSSRAHLHTARDTYSPSKSSFLCAYHKYRHTLLSLQQHALQCTKPIIPKLIWKAVTPFSLAYHTPTFLKLQTVFGFVNIRSSSFAVFLLLRTFLLSRNLGRD